LAMECTAAARAGDGPPAPADAPEHHAPFPAQKLARPRPRRSVRDCVIALRALPSRSRSVRSPNTLAACMEFSTSRAHFCVTAGLTRGTCLRSRQLRPNWLQGESCVHRGVGRWTAGGLRRVRENRVVSSSVEHCARGPPGLQRGVGRNATNADRVALVAPARRCALATCVGRCLPPAPAACALACSAAAASSEAGRLARWSCA